jgi:hypothetical protein
MVWRMGRYITTIISKIPEGAINEIDELHNTFLLITERGNSSAVINTSVAAEITSCSLKLAGIDTFDYH